MGRGRRGNGRESFGASAADVAEPEDEITVTNERGEIIEDEIDDIVVPAEETAPATKAEPEDDAYTALQRQFEALKSEREADAARLREFEQRANAQELDRFATEKALLEHAAAAARGELTAAKRAFADAMTANDFEAASEAQEAISAAQLDIRNYELAKDEIERQPAPKAKETVRAAPADPVEAYISQFTPKTQDWARTHKADLFSNQKRTEKAVLGHHLAVNEGVAPDTPEYFAFLDKHMGYGKEPEARKEPKTHRPPLASVPPSRGGGSKNEVSLTSAERDMASRLGMSTAKYAKYKLEALRGASDPEYRGPKYGQQDQPIGGK